MNQKELENLQRYIYKRPQNQSVQDIINRIEKENKKEKLTQEEWNKLLIPSCSGMIPELLKWLLNNGAKIIGDSVDLANMIIGSQEKRLKYLEKRIELLEILLANIEKQYSNVFLGTALLNACWYNNIYIVPYLVGKGADVNFESSNGKTPYECAKNYGERFGDYTLHNYLKNYVESGKFENPKKFYSEVDKIFGDVVYKPNK